MPSLTRRTVLAAAVATPAYAQAALAWRTLRPGLDHGITQIPSPIGDRRLDVLRIDPARFRFTMLIAAAINAAPQTARQWADAHDLVAATNAGMFRTNRLPVGYCKVAGRAVQPAMSADRSIFTFNDTNARLLDLSCDEFDPAAHENALQSIRMISCEGRNVWRQQPRIWSTACMAQDTTGKVLFLHARSPLSVHDFNNAIRAAPLDIARAMYLEGGPEATLYARGGDGQTIERFGSYETDFNENDDNDVAWALPNIIGVVPR
ncbi:MAG: phosphodiester glycosidase family protein [Hyphomonadaceae bacterium]